jgi:hypothetical protein
MMRMGEQHSNLHQAGKRQCDRPEKEAHQNHPKFGNRFHSLSSLNKIVSDAYDGGMSEGRKRKCPNDQGFLATEKMLWKEVLEAMSCPWTDALESNYFAPMPC